MKSVLLIDDDHGFRSLFTELFESHGWQVFQAEDGEAGLNIALQKKPDVVLCDLLMPRCNGFQFCRALKSQRDYLPNTRIVVTTGSAYATDRLNAFEAGADDYITKPIKPDELFKILEKASIGGSSKETDLLGPSLDPHSATRLKFWGVRGSIPTPGPDTVFYGGNTACVELRADGELIILDAGSGIRPLGRKIQTEFRNRPVKITILISHTHWDHIQGFPFFSPAYNSKNEVRILSFEGARRGLEATLASQMESPYFPISMQQMPGNLAIHELKDLEFAIGKVNVQATFMNHPGVCAGYRLRTSSGTVVYMPDNELHRRLRTSNKATGEAVQFAEEQDARFADFLRNADVAIMDAQYDLSEYENHISWGHSCVDDSVELAIRAGVKRLFLFHHDPDHDDTRVAQMLAHARQLAESHGSKLIVEAAREGHELVLD
ncbi:MAG: response regulator [Verrucomicrobiota bacterium]|nr:response regulator [Verrucomicrobiota bacterium]